MRNILTLHKKRNTLHGKLFVYMLVLACLLVFFVFTAMFLLGQFTNVKEQYRETLAMQLSLLEKEMNDQYDNAVISAVQLSQYAGKEIDTLLAEQNLAFVNLKDNRELLEALQNTMFEPLKNSLLQANVSGAFVVWDTTVNSSVKNAQDNRNGLYLQLDTRSTEKSTVIVYRGDALLGKSHGAMPHRKWRMEYNLSDIPGYTALLENAALPLDSAHRISPVFELPGTAEKAVLITVPIIGEDGTVYGLCGFELGQTYFKEHFSQPTTLEKLTCMFVPNANGYIDSSKALSSGVQNGYYFVPSEPLIAKDFGDGLIHLVGKNNEYIGATQKVALTRIADESLLVVMFPKEDYDAAVFRNNLEMLLTVLLLAFFAVGVCLLFSKRFIVPITKGLQNLHNSVEQPDSGVAKAAPSGFREIDELVAFVKDKMQSKTLETALPPNIEKMFNQFIELTGELTPSEMNALSLLIQGHEPNELPRILFISESTAKHHVLKIYKKLRVSSRGELLLYIEMLKGCGLIDKIQASE